MVTAYPSWNPTPVLLPGNSHGRRGLVGCSPWGREESDTAGRLHFHFSLLCIGEGNSNPLLCSCLENPRAGVAQSQTQLKWLSMPPGSLLLPVLLLASLPGAPVWWVSFPHLGLLGWWALPMQREWECGAVLGEWLPLLHLIIQE